MTQLLSSEEQVLLEERLSQLIQDLHEMHQRSLMLMTLIRTLKRVNNQKGE